MDMAIGQYAEIVFGDLGGALPAVTMGVVLVALMLIVWAALAAGSRADDWAGRP